jgi:hypothetical protein
VEALGGWHKDGSALITKLARQLASDTGKEADKQIKHLFQRLGILFKFQCLFLNSGKEIFDIQGLHCAEHFAVNPVLSILCQQNTRNMKPSQFLFSCQECDYHFNAKEQFREYIQTNHFVTTKCYHIYHKSNEDDDNFACDHCGKKL